MATRQDDIELLNYIHPLKLRGLMQAVYVSECLCNGETHERIVAKFKGDIQLVDMWVNFVKHNGWIRYDNQTQQWSTTEKGKQRIYEIICEFRPQN
jgi:hypothetical protein